MSESQKPELKAAPDPEVRDRPRRRTFTAKYKLKILSELDACSEPGESGAVLRREGLYSSHISEWRKKRAAGELQGLAPRKRGPRSRDPLVAENARLERETARLQEELRKARLIIDVQKKLTEILNIPLPPLPESSE